MLINLLNIFRDSDLKRIYSSIVQFNTFRRRIGYNDKQFYYFVFFSHVILTTYNCSDEKEQLYFMYLRKTDNLK